MRETVAVVGGGVAGLSAAHELVERGFTVHVYERRPFFGGKAASYRVPRPGAVKATLGEPPGEHGFRFFPGWYRHLTDTMRRIPYHRTGGGRRTVADNLVSVKSNLLTWFDRAPMTLPLRVPGSVNEAVTAAQFIAEFSGLGVTTAEVALFFGKMVEFLIASEEKRQELFEHQTWWEYLECSKPGRSRSYQDLVRATTRTMVAAKAEQASAYTIGRLGIRTLLDTMSTVDRVLNGPTNEVWIEPWIAHLKAKGVIFHTDSELKSLGFDSASRKVRNLVIEPIAVSRVRRLRNRITQSLRGDLQSFSGDDIASTARELAQCTDYPDWAPAAMHAAEVSTMLGKACAQSSAAGAGKRLDDAGFHAELGRLKSQLIKVESELAQFESEASATKPAHTVCAEYFVLALPLEQLAYYVNRSSMLTFLAPELRKVIRLSRELDWMAGIQFYFEVPLDIAPGHLVGIDSDWALTAIEHTQFWEDVELPRNVRAILSVDIAAWNKKGRKIRKEAFNCTPDEIALEVWAQLDEMLNKRDRSPLLREDMLVGGRLLSDISYHLDDTIVERYDRKKQAAYERARGVSFGTLEDLAEDPTADEKSVEDFMWGPRRLFNAEPLLINRAGTRKYRPDACTSVPNLFLAADYVKTETDLACMEGANEAARRAVNGILEAASSREARCDIWPFSPSRQAVEAVMAMAAPLQAVRSVTNLVSRLQGRFLKGFGGGQ